MKENYLTFTTTGSQWLNQKTNSYQNLFNGKTNIKLLAFFILTFVFFTGKTFAQVTITKPNLNIPVCSGFPSPYYTLGNIVITETANANFSGGAGLTLILSAPANFEFQSGVGTTTVAGGNNLAITSTVVNATTVTITYTCGGTNKPDVMTISNLSIRAINSASTQNITRTGGTGVINGLVAGNTLTNSLVSAVATPPTTANAGSNQTLAACATTTTLAGNTPAAGTGAWSVVSGTATVTTPSSPTSGVTGLALGTTATLRWTITNGSCPASTSDVTITTSNGPGCWAYCTPTSTSSTTYPISNVTFAGINNNSSAATSASPFYQDFSAISGNVVAGNTYTFTATATGVSPNPFGIYVFIDWNNNGDFSDDAGPYTVGTYTTNSATLSTSITVPLTATIGTTRIRVSNQYNVVPGPCPSGAGSFQDEDYSLNITAPPVCTTPTAQPTSLALTPAGTSISGSFTAAAPAPDSYLVVFNTTGVAPTPVNGTTYTTGSTINGSIVAETDGNTTFSIGGLNTSTLYYVYVFSFNASCTGGPLYNTTSPLFTTTTTTAVAPSYCSPSTTNAQASNRYIDDVSFLGTLNDINNFNTSYSSTPNNGFQNFTGLANKAIQAQGEGVNVYVEANSRGRWKSWVDWNKDGDFNDAGELVYDSNAATLTTTFGFVVPTTAIPGNYRIRIRLYNSFYTVGPPGPPTTYESYSYDFNSCEVFDTNIISGYTAYEYGEAEDYLFTVVPSCAANITSVTDGEVCGSGAVNLSVTGTAGVTQFRWYANEFGGAPITTTATGNWTTPVLATTTTYWVTAYNGSCESLVRTKVVAKVSPVPTLNFTPSNPQVCGENAVISLTATGDTELVYLIDEDFETGSGLGTFSNTNLVSNAAVNAQTMWQNHTSTFIPTGLTWYPAISSNFGANHFAMATSDVGTCGASCYYTVDNALVSPVVNSTSFTDLTLKFRMYYSRYFPDGNVTYDPIEFMQVQVSTNGGGAWTTINGNIITDQGIGTRLAELTYNLTAYINNPNLRIRIRYYASSWCDGAAVDDIQLYGTKPLNTAFNWSGASLPDAYNDAACTIPYVAGTPAVTVYVKPTLAQLEQGTYTFTASAILSNGCSASSPITVTNNSKVWKGTNSTDWNDAGNWSPVGVPTINNCVIIPATSIISGAGYNAYAKNLTVKNTGNLLQNSVTNLTVADWVNVNAGGEYNIKDDASLVQTNSAAVNSGIVKVEKITPPMYRFDYEYWNSPVTLASNFTLGTLSPNTLSDKYWSYDPQVWGTNGHWKSESTATVMNPAKGYCVRAPQTFSSSPATKTPFTGLFVGTPNNGVVTVPMYISTNATAIAANEQDLNLIGNPFPSAIDIAAFITDPRNTAVADGTIYLWSHVTPLSTANSDPFYQDYVYNYQANDYVTLNIAGSVKPIPSGYGVTTYPYVASGQSFFMRAKANGNVVMDNNMRVTGNNSTFYRSASETERNTDNDLGDIQKDRFWLNLTRMGGTGFSQMMLGYVEGASENWDNGFDSQALKAAAVSLYTFTEDKKLSIQSRTWPLNQTDIVPMGYKTNASGNYAIGIDSLDPAFETQDIFLEDRLLNVIYNLKSGPYMFTTEAGTFDNRFNIRYTNSTLSTEEIAMLEHSVFAYTNGKLNVKSSIEKIKAISIYDMLGRTLVENNDVNQNDFTAVNLTPTQSTLIIKVKLENGAVVSKKVIF